MNQSTKIPDQLCVGLRFVYVSFDARESFYLKPGIFGKILILHMRNGHAHHLGTAGQAQLGLDLGAGIGGGLIADIQGGGDVA